MSFMCACPETESAAIVNRLLRLASYVGNTAVYMVDRVEKLREDGYINRLEVSETQAGGKQLAALAGFVGQFYCEGAFAIGPEDALIVEAKVPEQYRYWSMILTNDICESIDWYNNQASLNASAAASVVATRRTCARAALLGDESRHIQ